MRTERSVLVESLLEQKAGYVAICGVRNQRDNRSNGRVSPFGNLPGGGYRGSATEAGGDSGVSGEISGCRGRFILSDSENLVNDLLREIRTL